MTSPLYTDGISREMAKSEMSRPKVKRARETGIFEDGRHSRYEQNRNRKDIGLNM